MTAEPGTRVLQAQGNEIAPAIAAAAACLAAGGLVAFPTETVYGLGADAGNGEAIARLYAAKGRPAFNPLIAHVASIDAARRLGRFDAAAEKLAGAFWPGPLTLVLPKQPNCGVADLALAGLDSVAVRVPAHPVARALLAAFKGPVVAPSANRSGHVSPTSAAHVLADLRGRIDMVIDAGPCAVGVEFDHRRLPGRTDAAAARRPAARGRSSACSDARLSSHRPTTQRRSRPACCRRIMRPRPDCASMPTRPCPAKRCSPSGRRRHGGARSICRRAAI